MDNKGIKLLFMAHEDREVGSQHNIDILFLLLSHRISRADGEQWYGNPREV